MGTFDLPWEQTVESQQPPAWSASIHCSLLSTVLTIVFFSSLSGFTNVWHPFSLFTHYFEYFKCLSNFKPLWNVQGAILSFPHQHWALSHLEGMSPRADTALISHFLSRTRHLWCLSSHYCICNQTISRNVLQWLFIIRLFFLFPSHSVIKILLPACWWFLSTTPLKNVWFFNEWNTITLPPQQWHQIAFVARRVGFLQELEACQSFPAERLLKDS